MTEKKCRRRRRYHALALFSMSDKRRETAFKKCFFLNTSFTWPQIDGRFFGAPLRVYKSIKVYVSKHRHTFSWKSCDSKSIDKPAGNGTSNWFDFRSIASPIKCTECRFAIPKWPNCRGRSEKGRGTESEIREFCFAFRRYQNCTFHEFAIAGP